MMISEDLADRRIKVRVGGANLLIEKDKSLSITVEKIKEAIGDTGLFLNDYIDIDATLRFRLFSAAERNKLLKDNSLVNIDDLLLFFDALKREGIALINPLCAGNPDNKSFISALILRFAKYLLTYANSFLLHSAGISFGDKGFLFIGKSGSGKTTLSKIAENEGFEVLDDESIITSKRTDDYYLSAFLKAGKEPVRMQKAFLLIQGRKNYIDQISLNERVRYITPEVHSLPQGPDRIRAFNGLLDFYNQAPLYKLYFRKDISLRELLKEEII